jgi:hypothetical protein
MEGVEEILIADSRVIPDGGKVNIFPEAKMETLEKCDDRRRYCEYVSCNRKSYARHHW